MVEGQAAAPGMAVGVGGEQVKCQHHWILLFAVQTQGANNVGHHLR
jgi:hypothetical protein